MTFTDWLTGIGVRSAMAAPNALEDPVPSWVTRTGALLGIALFVLILCSPTPEGLSSAGQRMAAVAALMGIFWVAQVLPMEVTSLLPLALFPVLGVQSAKDVSAAYFTDNSFLYLGGFILALGIERWGLHRRFALHIVAATGTGVRRIVFGYMLATFAISMWISNTAATLLMLPIAMALLTSLEQLGRSSSTLSTDGNEPAESGMASSEALAARRKPRPAVGLPADDPQFARLGMAVMLGIGYAATLGGMATIVGTPTNIVYVEVIQKQFPDAPPLSAAEWMTTWGPCAFAFLVMTWLLITFRLRTPAGLQNWDRGFFRRQLQQLGPMQAGERWMLAVFSLTAALWLSRTGFDAGGTWRIPGWNVWASQWLAHLDVPKGGHWINDSTVAMVMALVMFTIPVRTHPDRPREQLMDWHTAGRLPWGILLLFGGGFAIAEASRTSGLAEWAGSVLAQSAQGLPIWLVIGLICLLVTFLSEFTSNVATANALLPIIAGLAVALGIDPRLLMLPATLAASNGFMLPIGTPPNAIVFGTGRIRMSQMVTYGLILDLAGVALIVLATYTLLVPQLHIDTNIFPAWAVGKD